VKHCTHELIEEGERRRRRGIRIRRPVVVAAAAFEVLVRDPGGGRPGRVVLRQLGRRPRPPPGA